MALGGGIDPVTNERVEQPAALVERRRAAPGFGLTMLPIAPLMHGATQWGVMGAAFRGNEDRAHGEVRPGARVAAGRAGEGQLDHDHGRRDGAPADRGARGPRRELRPVVALRDQQHRGAVLAVGEGPVHRAAPRTSCSPTRSARPRAATTAYSIVEKGKTAMKGGPTVKAVRDTVVVDETCDEVEPGSGVVGKVARKGNIPLEYYKDPEKTAQTFVTAPDGIRYSIPGDFATLEADGTITLLGRGSVSINSGGEKIFPEEVEGAVTPHPDVVRLRGGRRARRALGPAGRRGRAAPARLRARTSTPSRSTAASTSPATSCRARSTTSTTSSARRPASPTTAGPRRSPPARSRPPDATPARPGAPVPLHPTLQQICDAANAGRGRGRRRAAALRRGASGCGPDRAPRRSAPSGPARPSRCTRWTTTSPTGPTGRSRCGCTGRPPAWARPSSATSTAAASCRARSTPGTAWPGASPRGRERSS